jgi:membrane dipeptidase
MALPVFDGHNDVLLAERSFADRSDAGHLDLERARAGGFAGGFFAIFTPHPDGFPDDAQRGPDVPPEPPVSHARALQSTLAGIGKLLAL